MCATATAKDTEPDTEANANANAELGEPDPSDAPHKPAPKPPRPLIVERSGRALDRGTPRRMTDVAAALRNAIGTPVKARVEEVGLNYPPARLALIALKEERQVEIWGANEEGAFTRIHTYPIRAASGGAGPKTRYGDEQVPEGEYRLSLMNPASRFHLSMKISYPNRADRDQAVREGRFGLGGDIYMHGSNVSIGCIAIGDRAIEEVFFLVAESGHANVEVIVAPRDLRLHAAPDDRREWVNKRYARIATRIAAFRASCGGGVPVNCMTRR